MALRFFETWALFNPECGGDVMIQDVRNYVSYLAS